MVEKRAGYRRQLGDQLHTFLITPIAVGLVDRSNVCFRAPRRLTRTTDLAAKRPIGLGMIKVAYGPASAAADPPVESPLPFEDGCTGWGATAETRQDSRARVRPGRL